MTAGIGIGTAADHIETKVTTLSARATSGGIYVLESDALIIGDTSASISRVNQDNTLTTVADATQSDMSTTNNGTIVLVTGGSLELTDGTASADGMAISANGSGIILLEATSGSISSTADVLSGSGHITVRAADSITFDAVDLTTSQSGTIYAEAGSGSITLNSDSSITSGSGAIRLLAQGDITLGGVITTTGNVSITATTGSILDGDGTDTTVDIMATGLRLIAGTGIGQLGNSVNAIETMVTTLTARSGSGGVNILESNSLIIGDVTATVQKIGRDGLPVAVIDATQSDVRTTNNGTIVIVSGGSLTLNDGSATADVTAISANGSGSILLQTTAGGIRATASIISGSGQITVVSADSISVESAANLTTTNSGTIALESATGSITLSSSSNVTSGSGAIRLLANSDVTLGGVISTTGNVSITATTGSILDGDGNNTTVDIAATGLRLNAGTGIGQLGSNSNPIETRVTTLTARSGSGGMNVLESDALTIDDVTVTVQKTGRNGVPVATTDATQSDLRTTSSGTIVIVSGDTLTLNDGSDNNNTAITSSGSVLLRATTGSIIANAGMTMSGSLSLASAADFTQSGTIDISGTGTVDIYSGGSITMTSGSRTIATNNIRYAATGSLNLTSLVSGAAISLSGSTITADGSLTNNITADILRMTTSGTGAGSGIGSGTTPLKTSVATLSADSKGMGGIFLTESDAITITRVPDITVSRVQADGSTVADTDASLIGLTSAGPLVLNGGAITSTVTTGNIQVAGNILLHGTALTLGGTTTGTGNITLTSSHDIVQSGSLTATGSGSTVELSATGSILMSQGAVTATSDGSILFQAGQNITLSELTAGTGSVAIIAAGSISDLPGDSAVDIAASGLILSAGGAIASAVNPLETTVVTLTAHAGSGSLYLTETNAIVLSTVSLTVNHVDDTGVTSVTNPTVQAGLASGGGLVLLSGGSITTATGSGDITASDNILLANRAGKLTLDGSLTSTRGNITLASAGTLIQNGAISTGTTGKTIDLISNSGITMGSGVITATHNGNIRLTNSSGSIVIGSLIAGSGTVAVGTIGTITDTADGSITAENLLLSASGSIGSQTNPLTATTSYLSATSGSSSYLNVTGTVTITALSQTVNRVDEAAVATETAAITQQGLSSGLDLILVAGGSLNSTLLTGDVTATGNILLQSLGSDCITLAGETTSTAGNISLDSYTTINLNNDISVGGSGKTIDLLAVSAITMAPDVVATTNDGNIRYQAGSDVTLSTVTAGTGSVAIIATKGSIIDQGTNNGADITAGNLILNAGSAIADNDNHIEIAVSNLSTQSGSGTYLTEQGDVTITALSQSANRIASSGSVTTVSSSQEDVTSGTDLVLSAPTGSIVINGGADNSGVQSGGSVLMTTGSANVLSDITLNSGVTGGNINLISSDTIQQNDKGTISGSDVYVKSTNGITMADGSASTATNNGSIMYESAAGDIVLTQLSSGKNSGKIAVIATVGNIMDASGQTGTGIVARDLILNAGGAIGKITDSLGIDVANMSTKSGSGSTYLDADASVKITDLSQTVNVIQDNGTVVQTTTTSQNDLNESNDIILTAATGDIVIDAGTSNNGVTNVRNVNLLAKTGNIIINCGSDKIITASNSIIMTALNGSITINGAPGSAGMTAVNDILLSAGKATGTNPASVTLNGFITSSSGNITITAVDDITQNAGGDMAVTAPGATIDLQATGAITMVDGATGKTNNGSIRYEAGGNLTVTGLDAGTGIISLKTGGSVIDGGESAADVIGSALRIEAAQAVGSSASHLETVVARLAARAGGGLYINETGALMLDTVGVVTVNRVQGDGVPTVALSDASALSDITSGGNVSIRTTGGGLTTMAGSGDITATGTVDLQSAQHLVQNGSITGHDVLATAVGNVLMSSSAVTTSSRFGSVYYGAGNNIAAGTITADKGVVTLKAGASGEITDSSNGTLSGHNVTASALNMIGQGAMNRSAKPGDQTVATLSKGALKTDVDTLYTGSYSTASKSDYRIGSVVTGILRSDSGWSVQVVNDGFVIPNSQFVNSFAAQSSLAGGSTTVSNWQYVRDFNYQLLENVAVQSEVVRTQQSAPAPAKLVARQAGTTPIVHKQTSLVVSSSKVTASVVNSAVRSGDEAGRIELGADLLQLDGARLIPTFGTATYDQMVVNGTQNPLQFEYWIENMMF